MRFILSLLVVSFSGPVLAQDTAIDLRVAVFPYIPEGESALERVESAFEAFAAQQAQLIDLDLDLVNTYGDALPTIEGYDVAEIDLCMLDALRSETGLKLDPIPERCAKGPWVEPAKQVMETADAKYVAPHWVCGNFLVHWNSDEGLSACTSFESILEALDPDEGRFLLADLWGGGTLGEYYADAVLDIYGHDEARRHLIELGAADSEQIARLLKPDALFAISKLTRELKAEHRMFRKRLHDLSYVYPREFAVEQDSALLGYSERLHFSQRRAFDEPWSGKKIPITADDLVVRSFPFADKSNGTPTWVDAFVIPAGKFKGKERAIALFLEFVLSQDGYQIFLEPREYYPSAYLLPAADSVYTSNFVTERMPALLNYRDSLDGSFPILSHRVYLGIDRGGDAVKAWFENRKNHAYPPTLSANDDRGMAGWARTICVRGRGKAGANFAQLPSIAA